MNLTGFGYHVSMHFGIFAITYHAAFGAANNAARRTILTIFLARYAVKNSKLRKCKEPPRTDKNQKLTNADN